MTKESECEKSLRDHLCQGPLYKIRINNKEEKIFCLNVIKKLIRQGVSIDILENIPRKFKETKSDRFEINES